MTQADLPPKSRRTVPLSLYDALEAAKPAEKTDLLLSYMAQTYIKDHNPSLALPARNGRGVHLTGVDLSVDTINSCLARLGIRFPVRYRLFDPNPQPPGIVFAGANLQGARLGGANLRGTDLTHANLQGATLLGANLRGVDLTHANLQGATLLGANLQGATMLGANLQGAVFAGATLQGADLTGANLQGVELKGADLRGAILREVHLEGIDLTIANIQSISISGSWLDRTRLRHEQLGAVLGDEEVAAAGFVKDEFDQKDHRASFRERAELYQTAKFAYLALKQNFESLGDYDAASWAYRKERYMERSEAFYTLRAAYKDRKWREGAKAFGAVFSAVVQEGLCDYGESFGRTLLWIVLTFLLFGLVFTWTNSIYQGDPPNLHLTHDLADGLRFSLGAMTTMGADGLKAACPIVEIATRIEALLTVALTGLLGFVVGNRIRHS